jgi:CBS domain-containing protein
MRCEDVMTGELEVATVGETVLSAATKMRDMNIGFLPVCSSADRSAVGTLTDRDIALRVVAEERPSSTLVEEVMSPDLVACRPQDDLKIAEELMRTNQVSRVLCIDDGGRVAGVISLADIAQYDSERRAGQLLADVTEREFHVH